MQILTCTTHSLLHAHAKQTNCAREFSSIAYTRSELEWKGGLRCGVGEEHGARSASEEEAQILGQIDMSKCDAIHMSLYVIACNLRPKHTHTRILKSGTVKENKHTLRIHTTATNILSIDAIT